MSYAIVRNEKLTRDEVKGRYVHNERKTRDEVKGRYVHNERKTRGHTNKDIIQEKTYLNYYLKKNEMSYIKEFDKMRKENDLQGFIKSNSIIMCEMIFTSDKEFFDKIGEEETKRYFQESYKFVCNYKKLGEQNIISSVVHLDEGTPHMHLLYIPVVHTKDKECKKIDKICCRDFWKGRDSYRKLQNCFFEDITSKGFILERGLPIEETGAKHERIEDLKKITNFENTKKVLNNIKLELPETPDINDIELIQLNKTKVENEIIKPKDELINKLYEENVTLHKELLKQVNLVNVAQKYQKERDEILEDNKKLNNQIDNIKAEYKEKEFDIEWKFKSKIRSLEKENNHLNNIVNRFYDTVEKFIKWICKKFGIGESKDLIRDFEKDTNILIDPERQLKREEIEREWDLER